MLVRLTGDASGRIHWRERGRAGGSGDDERERPVVVVFALIESEAAGRGAVVPLQIDRLALRRSLCGRRLRRCIFSLIVSDASLLDGTLGEGLRLRLVTLDPPWLLD